MALLHWCTIAAFCKEAHGEGFGTYGMKSSSRDAARWSTSWSTSRRAGGGAIMKKGLVGVNPAVCLFQTGSHWLPRHEVS